MKPSRWGRLGRATLAGAIVQAIALCWLSSIDTAKAVTVTVTKPANKVPAAETIQLRDQITGQIVNIVTVIPPGTNAVGKATLIINQAIAAFKATGISTTAIVQTTPTSFKFIGFNKITSSSATREKSKIGMGPTFADSFVPGLSSVDYVAAGGTLSGADDNGSVAQYEAGFDITDTTLGNVSLLADVSFSDLTAPTVDDLLTTEFNILETQLTADAPSLAPDLTLDLADGSIDLTSPGTFADVAVTNANTDVAVTASIEITAVPEPPLLLIVAGSILGTIMLARRRNGHLPRTAGLKRSSASN